MQIFRGKVIHTNMQKTARVAVTRIVAHPVYKKRYKKVKHYLVHDEIGVKPGEIVRFVASKPFSKLKRWKMLEVVKPDASKVVKTKGAKKDIKKK
ncbi:30S ribosomal protein S17 [Candidatus Woesebacteria bacterium GWA1_41_8]|uniref:30S ribosomal protein S17 n=1 Tax=Candidatus Woesebacteria bacterium GWA1_41_8 TaxID=1802471 RepID=A0A1F7WIZ4_9BACT|nr:MAG: 30S ribosomal protein S17 [Candidatus Woesebacteria bacterium GWA1_41_8]